MSGPARAPLVSFLVPCYRLAHLLDDCVRSILAQDFDDFEVLILDDCSPDNTPEVAASFNDPRVRHIRHPQNLGHLRNFNDEGDGELHGSVGPVDAVWRGHDFLDHLLAGNIVPAPAALARRTAYEAAGRFPLDLPFAGDWYMWAAFAYQGDVIYMAEPMVKYRLHPLNMTKTFLDRAAALVRDEVEVLWRLKALVENSGNEQLRRRVVNAIGQKYALHVGRLAADGWTYGLTVDSFEESLQSHPATPAERASIRRVTYAALGDGHVEADRPALAHHAYRQALTISPFDGRTLAKLVLVALGPPGRRLRRALSRKVA